MEKKYVLCPRCELNYMFSTEKYCDICKAELGLVKPDFLLPDEEEETEGILCPICKTNYCEEGEDLCIECKKERAAKDKNEEEETDEWVDDEDVSDINSDIDGMSLGSYDDEEGDEESEEEDGESEDDFEYINPDDYTDDGDDEEEAMDDEDF